MKDTAIVLRRFNPAASPPYPILRFGVCLWDQASSAADNVSEVPWQSARCHDNFGYGCHNHSGCKSAKMMCSQPANVTILLQDELYTPYLGQLAKLAFLASAVHQAIFTIFSTLPFAVGQVRITVLSFSKLGPKGQPCKFFVIHMLPTSIPSGTTLAQILCQDSQCKSVGGSCAWHKSWSCGFCG